MYEIFWTNSSLFIIIYTDNHLKQDMPQIIEKDDILGIQRLLQRLAAAEGVSIYELAERSGLHPTTLYAILKKRPSATRRPVRRETIRSLAGGNGYIVTFDAVRKRIILERTPESGPRDGVEELLEGLRRVLGKSTKKHFTPDEKQKILDIVRVLLS